MEALNNFFDSASASLGAPVDHFKLLILLLASIPLSLPLPYLSSTLAHVYSIGTSYFFVVTILRLQWGFIQLLFMSLYTWAICKWAISSPKQAAGLKYSWPWIVFFLTMGQLTLNHAYRFYAQTPLSEIEITGLMMVLVQKLVFFAWNTFDRNAVRDETKTPEIPLLAFLGYCFFFPSVLVGPGVHYDTYMTYTNSPLPKGRFQIAFTRLGLGIFSLALFVVVAPKASYEFINEPAFLTYNPLTKLLFANAAGFLARTKYYAIWCIAESACIVSGIARIDNLTAKVEQWSGARNVRIYGIEFAENWKVLLDSWNCFTNVWLRETVYKRLVPKGSKPGFNATIATFGTSALWHGLNISYYLTFFLGAFLQALARKMRKYIRPLFIVPPASLTAYDRSDPSSSRAAIKIRGRLWQAAGIVVTQMTVNFAVLPFIMMDLQPTLKAWSRLGYYGVYMTFIPSLFFWFQGHKLLPRSVEAGKATPKRSESSDDNGINILGHERSGLELHQVTREQLARVQAGRSGIKKEL